MADALRGFLAPRTDADTHRRLVAQNSSAVSLIPEVVKPIYYAHCYYCGWGANDYLSLDEVERRAEQHLEQNPDHKGHILTAFDAKGVQVRWR